MPYTSSCEEAIIDLTGASSEERNKEFFDQHVLTVLKSTPFFYELTQEEFSAIAKEITVHHLKRDAFVIREKEAGDSLFFVMNGTLQTSIKHKNTLHDVNIAKVEKGGVFGEFSLLAGRTRPATVRTLSDCELIEIPGPVYQKVALKYSSTRRFLIDLCRHYDRKTEANLKLLDINRRKHQRVTYQGKVILQKYNSEGTVVPMPLSKGLLVDVSEEGISFFMHKREMSGSISDIIGEKCKAKVYIETQNSSVAVKILGKIVGLETGIQRGELGNFFLSRMKFLFVDKIDKKALKEFLSKE